MTLSNTIRARMWANLVMETSASESSGKGFRVYFPNGLPIIPGGVLGDYGV